MCLQDLDVQCFRAVDEMLLDLDFAIQGCVRMTPPFARPCAQLKQLGGCLMTVSTELAPEIRTHHMHGLIPVNMRVMSSDLQCCCAEVPRSSSRGPF